MSEQLLVEASKMFENENQWQAACKLADLIPDIKTFWFSEFMENFSEKIESHLKKDQRFEDFQIIEGPDNGDERYWCFIMPKESSIRKHEDGEPLGLSTGIEVAIEGKAFHVKFGLIYIYEGKRAPAFAKLDKFFNETLGVVICDLKPDEKEDWNCNGWIIWDYLSPKGKKADLFEPDAIYYLHGKGQEFMDDIIEKILTFISKHRNALISAHNQLIKRMF